jgi:hypothetical protein
MDFIARNTTIPVPRVLDILGIRGSIHIVQEYIDAPVLADVWTQMGLDERKSCMGQLQEYLEQLRALTPPEPGRVQAVDGTGCLDDRLHPGEWGPFDSIDTFNAFFHHDLVRQRPADYPHAQDSLAKASRPNIGELYSLMAILVLTISSGKMGGLSGLLTGSVRGGSQSTGSIRDHISGAVFSCQVGGRCFKSSPISTLKNWKWSGILPLILSAYSV